MKETMTPEQFRAWRKSLRLKQKEAADLLGLKKRMIQYYETGTREGKKVKIPKYIRLACYALSQGIEDFDGVTAIALTNDAKIGPAETDEMMQNGSSDGYPAKANGHADHLSEDGPDAELDGDGDAAKGLVDPENQRS